MIRKLKIEKIVTALKIAYGRFQNGKTDWIKYFL